MWPTVADVAFVTGRILTEAFNNWVPNNNSGDFVYM